MLRALTSGEQERRVYLGDMLLYFKIQFRSEPVINQPSGINTGIFSLPLDLGEARAKKEKTAVGLSHRPAGPLECCST